MTSETPPTSLAQIPADRHLVAALYSQGQVSRAEHDQLLQMVTPHQNWVLWISRLLLTTGSGLVLAGIVYFFAFNWAAIPPMAKLGGIQALLVLCLAGSWYRGLSDLAGKVLLLAASVLVGIFMAVFGQIYQTGADAWQLFMMWALFIFGWTLLSRFAAQWLLWLVIANIFIATWNRQSAWATDDITYASFAGLVLLNGGILALREGWLKWRSSPWLSARWTRLVPVFILQPVLVAPALGWIILFQDSSQALIICALAGIAGLAALFALYQRQVTDMACLAATMLSFCIIAETLLVRVIYSTFSDSLTAVTLFGGLATLAIFGLAIKWLQKIHKEQEASA